LQSLLWFSGFLMTD